MESVLPIAIVPVSGSPLRSRQNRATSFAQHVADHFVPHARNNYHPHVFSHRMVGLFSMLLISLKIFTIALVSFGPVLPAYSSAITASNIISLTNKSRTDLGIGSLSESNVLDTAAQAKANDMLAKSYFSHNSPDGRTPWDFITAAGYNYITAGENLAVNFTEAENVEDAWMNSPGHKANIVNKNFQEIGIGIAQGQYQGHEAIFVVQMFGTSSQQKVALSDQPTVVQNQTIPAPVPAPASPAPAQAAVKKQAQQQPQPQPETVAAQNLDQAPPEQIPSAPVALEILDTKVTVDGQLANISAVLSGPAVRVLATYGKHAVMLEPKTENTWLGQVTLSALSEQNSTVFLKAYDMEGKVTTSQVADFNSTTKAAYQPQAAGSVAGAQVSFAGKMFNPKVFQQKFYLIFIAAMLVGLIVAIGLKRHVQHLSLVANGSFVIILATLLWYTS